MPDNPRQTAREQRARRLRADRALAKEIAAEYGKAWANIKVQLDDLGEQIKQAKAKGEPVNRGWLVKQHRLQQVEAQVRGELRYVLDLTERKITDAQVAALIAGRQDARELLLATLGPAPTGAAIVPALPVGATEQMIGRTSAGQPLHTLLNALGEETAQAVRSKLAAGVALGQNPRVIARTIRTTVGMSQARALTIARTEVLGVHRAAALDTYRANTNLVTGWQWDAQLGPRTCAMCISMHGTLHTLDETLDSHPSCRCAMAPTTRTWADLGFPGVRETRVELEAGENWFARQEEPIQYAILGRGKFDAYRRGELKLADLVQETDSRMWGKGRREKSLRDALSVAA